jgi:hypothetical protein
VSNRSWFIRVLFVEINLTGCGMHKDSIMRNISVNQRCTCDSKRQQDHQQSSSQLAYFNRSSGYPYK